ncbi:unnamed protein product [Bursaphelenchus okinawaensis]|uniref:Glycine-rich protein n=1 Tax=Bursaphelenchus okinawaensis TaxID=465554 RepID=A0A811LX40_9BILA|nr:unnamed protein product [Bursaphelenchus okinawaensis]CAG9128660.1 unnamed protein product [Bursaphelenchus okinawaensis]
MSHFAFLFVLFAILVSQTTAQYGMMGGMYPGMGMGYGGMGGMGMYPGMGMGYGGMRHRHMGYGGMGGMGYGGMGGMGMYPGMMGMGMMG